MGSFSAKTLHHTRRLNCDCCQHVLLSTQGQLTFNLDAILIRIESVYCEVYIDYYVWFYWLQYFDQVMKVMGTLTRGKAFDWPTSAGRRVLVRCQFRGGGQVWVWAVSIAYVQSYCTDSHTVICTEHMFILCFNENICHIHIYICFRNTNRWRAGHWAGTTHHGGPQGGKGSKLFTQVSCVETSRALIVFQFEMTGSLQYTAAQTLSRHQGRPSDCAVHYRQEAGGLYL